jgi:voltage-gated potassium channel
MLLRTDAKVSTLRRTPLFENLSRRDLAQVAKVVVEQELEAGSVLMREGEPADRFYVILDGEIDVRKRGRRVAELGAGSFVGEIALLSRSPRTATVTATTAVRALMLTGDDFIDLLDSIPELWLKVARALAERIDVEEAFLVEEGSG